MKNILMLIVALVFLGGCSFNRPPVSQTGDWRNEILMAQDCGMDGLPCCTDRNQPCQYGQECCANPANDKNNYCADKCELGKSNTFCRLTDPKCDSGFACRADRCLACGAESAVCCDSENKCAAGLECFEDKCVQCGSSGAPCCDQGLKCNNEAKRDATRNECYNGICVFCGSSNSIACQSEPRCNPGRLLNNDFCLPCGDYNQPCCNAASGRGYECNPQENLNCILGFCSRAQ